MNQPRVNIYGFPHKGLRNGLMKLSYQLGQLNLHSQEQIKEVTDLAEELSELLRLHLRSEEEFVLPPLEAKVPGSTEHNHEDHLAMEKLENDMVSAVKNLKTQASQPALEVAYAQTNLFIREYFRHMSEEEEEINEVIWANFTDEEILQWQGQILAHLTPDQFNKWFKYIIPALQPMEQTIMLSGFKANAPAEAYQQTIESLLPLLRPEQAAHVQAI